MIDLSLHHYPYESTTAAAASSTAPAPQTSPPAQQKDMNEVAPPSSPQLPTSNHSFAFLVHSQDTIPNNLPPDVDNKPLARQRRRRTSPEDQAILEEEFLRDSKPDKAARTRIVERVALGEKEVQIWFQNRRQSSRRKSRPLLPHEIEGHLHGSSESSLISSDSILSDDVTMELSRSSSSIDVASRADGMSESALAASCREAEAAETLIKMEDTQHSMPEESVVRKDTVPTQAKEHGFVEPAPRTMSTVPVPATPAQTLPKFVDSSSSVPAFTSSSVARPMLSSEFTMPSSVVRQDVRDSSPPPVSKSLKRTRSSLRIGMTSDGGAKLLTPDEQSPSPPRLIALASFQRSSSNTGVNDSFCSSQGSVDGFSLRRVPSGRSRDSRAWEFWCDSEARNGLAKAAQTAQKGSALDALTMMRSTSLGPPPLAPQSLALNPLASNPSKRNANVKLARTDSFKRLKLSHTAPAKSALSRTSSAVGRLEKCADAENAKASTKPTKASASFTITSASSDSDKENDDPIPSITLNRRRQSPTKTQRRRPILGESQTAPTPTVSQGRASDVARRAQAERRAQRENNENYASPEEDDEVRDFMKGAQSKEVAAVGSAAEDDLDCIQGLLKLSQGNWR